MSGARRLDSPLRATLAGIRDALGRGPERTLGPDARLDGQVVMVTGANRGLGFGIAQRLAERGARLFLACRSGGPEAAADLRERTGNAEISTLPLDLSEPSSVRALVNTLAACQIVLDRLVLNAAVVPLAARQTPAGLDIMFHVNFLGNVDLMEQLLESGVLANDVLGPTPPARPARVVIVTSEAHRSAVPGLDNFGVPTTYGTSGVMAAYGQSKLYLTTYAQQLSRLLPADQIGVHAICPGAVASDIAREAPRWMKPLLGPTMKLLFQSPYQAAGAVAWLVCASEIEGRTGLYHHMHTPKAPLAWAADPEAGAALRARARSLVEEIR